MARVPSLAAGLVHHPHRAQHGVGMRPVIFESIAVAIGRMLPGNGSIGQSPTTPICEDFPRGTWDN